VAVADELGVARQPDFDRQPPQDLQAEQSVLGGMLLSKDAIADVVEVLRSGDFYRPAHQMLYDTILDLYGRGEPADAITVSAELTRSGQLLRVGGTPYLHTLISAVPTAANAGFYAEIVAERATLRRLVEAGTRIVQLGYGAASGQGGDVDEVVDRAQAEIYDVTERRTSEDYIRLEQLLQGTMDEIDAISSRGGASIGVPTGFAELDQITNGLHPGQMVIVAARPAIGKALALDTPLPTPDGWTTMGAVAVGDLLFGADGRPTTVVAATEVMRGRPCYEVEFSDGTVIVADAEHQWRTSTRSARRARSERTAPRLYRSHESVDRVRDVAARAAEEPDRPVTRQVLVGDAGAEVRAVVHTVAHGLDPAGAVLTAASGAQRTSERHTPACSRRELSAALSARVGRPMGGSRAGEHADVVTTEQLARALRCTSADRRPSHAVALAAPLELPDADLPVPPYALGAWLGHDTTAAAQLTTADPEIVAQVEADGVQVTKTAGGPATTGFGPCAARSARTGSLPAMLRPAGVLGDKHIPATYLRASEAQRRALLAGLLDADGTVQQAGTVVFAVTNRRLAEDVRELVLSLGYRATISTRPVRGRAAESSTCYSVCFTPADPVFRLPRKLARQRSSMRTADRRYVVDVRPVPSVPVRCVQVDNADHLYLASRSMVPTHNSTLALDFSRACSIKHGLTSAIFSLEMSKSEITMRLLSAEAKVPLHHMRSGHMSDDDWARLARRMGEVADAPLYIDDSPNLTMMEIRAKARRLKQRHDLRLVVVDYLQLMSSGKRVESRQVEVSEFSRSLKLLAKELEVPVVAISQLNRGPEQRTDKKPLLSDLRESGCMTADTTILRADTGAPITFGQLLDRGVDGVQVWSLDEHRRLVPSTLTAVFASGVKDVFRLTLASGRTVTASGNHPFLTFGGWVALADLAAGDRVAVPRRIPAPLAGRLGWSEHRLGLLAHLLGDGCVLSSQPVHYTSQDEENLAFVEAAATVEFGIQPRRQVQGAWQHTYLPAPDRLTHGRRNPIVQWFHDLGIAGLRSYEKRLPDELYAADDAEVRLFLRHLWATGGSVFVPAPGATKSIARVYYSTSSRALADGVVHLLGRLGLASRLYPVRDAKSERPGYHVVVAGSRDMRRFCAEVGVHGRRGAEAAEYLAFSSSTIPNTTSDTLPIEVGDVDDVRWDRVVGIDFLGARPVYDATVKETHNFIADGVVAHNSLEQDADMVILLHREDAYERESPRAGEADLVLAKHRNGPTGLVTVAFQGHYSRFVDMAT
jgi:replicative DNA helicase